MLKIVFANAKGGVGKSTTTLLTACVLAHLGKKVALIDSDVNQKTLSKGVSYLNSQNLIPNGIELYDKNKEYDVLIYDTPGRLDSVETQDAIQDATNIILITSPSAADLFTARDTAEMLKEGGHDHKTKILFNKIRKGTKSSSNLDRATELIGLERIQNPLYLRSSFEGLFLDGWNAITHQQKGELSLVMLEMIVS